MAHGRSPSWAIPVHAILSVEQNKKKEKKRKRKGEIFLFFFWLLSLFFKQESELRRGPKNAHPGQKGCALSAARPFGLVFAVGRRGEKLRRSPFFLLSLAARPAQPNKTFLKRNIAFSFLIKLYYLYIYLVYRPEHGRTTRRT